MRHSPLIPFLATLDAEICRLHVQDYERITRVLSTRGTWDMARVRDSLASLLAKNEDQRDRFLAAFDSRFPPLRPPAGMDIHVSQVLSEIEALREGRVLLPAQLPLREEASSASPAHPSLPIRSAAQAKSTGAQDEPEKTSTELEADDGRSQAEPEESEPLVAPVRPSSQAIHGWRSDAPRLFRLETIGGRAQPRLSENRIVEIADAVGYFQSDVRDRRMDVAASVVSTIKTGGLPEIVYRMAHRIRQVLILLDSFTEALTWNSAPHELASGLRTLGVPVLKGQFRGNPESFATEDGRTCYLEDLDADRRGCLLLLFSDARACRRLRARYSLERLSKWPMVAWLDPCASEFADSSIDDIGHYGIPVYSATPEGILAAVRRFTTEIGSTTVVNSTTPQQKALYEVPVAANPQRVRAFLADSLPWAGACAMIRPITIGLCDALRARFYPELPPERLDRLLALPGTIRMITGIQFSSPVLLFLRKEFAASHTDKEQTEVLSFILAEIEKTEPSDRDSPAHSAWEVAKQCVQIEIDPDRALRRLATLSSTPLSRDIVSRLSCLVETSTRQGEPSGTHTLLLRQKPTSRDAPDWLRTIFPATDVSVAVEAYSAKVPTAPELLRNWRIPDLGMQMIWVEPGEIARGDSDTLLGSAQDMAATIRVSQGFWLGRSPVTQEQYEHIVLINPSFFATTGPDGPVEQVSWHDAVRFCQRLTQRESEAGRLLDGFQYCLPTETQWEYCCRAGATTAYNTGEVLRPNQAKFMPSFAEGQPLSNDYRASTIDVGSHAPNAWGFVDMHGNVWEWCADIWREGTESSNVGTQGSATDQLRVIRGGSWCNPSWECQSASRFRFPANDRYNFVGFRVAMCARGSAERR